MVCISGEGAILLLLQVSIVEYAVYGRFLRMNHVPSIMYSYQRGTHRTALGDGSRMILTNRTDAAYKGREGFD